MDELLRTKIRSEVKKTICRIKPLEKARPLNDLEYKLLETVETAMRDRSHPIIKVLMEMGYKETRDLGASNDEIVKWREDYQEKIAQRLEGMEYTVTPLDLVSIYSYIEEVSEQELKGDRLGMPVYLGLKGMDRYCPTPISTECPSLKSVGRALSFSHTFDECSVDTYAGVIDLSLMDMIKEYGDYISTASDVKERSSRMDEARAIVYEVVREHANEYRRRLNALNIPCERIDKVFSCLSGTIDSALTASFSDDGKGIIR